MVLKTPHAAEICEHTPAQQSHNFACKENECLASLQPFSLRKHFTGNKNKSLSYLISYLQLVRSSGWATPSETKCDLLIMFSSGEAALFEKGVYSPFIIALR